MTNEKFEIQLSNFRDFRMNAITLPLLVFLGANQGAQVKNMETSFHSR
jgi:hypothetical protein